MALLLAIVIFIFQLRLAKLSTPIDFALDKTSIGLLIQLLSFTTALIVIGIYSLFFGSAYIYANLFPVFIISYIVSRILRSILFFTIGRVPLAKSGMSNSVAIVVNYYLGVFLLNGYINYIAGL